MKILILSAQVKSYSTLSLKRAATDKGHEVTILDPSKLSPFISDKTGYDRIYDNYYKDFRRLYLNEFDIIIPRMTNLKYTTYVLDLMNNSMGIYSTQSALAIKKASNKLDTLLSLSAVGVPVPKTLMTNEASSTSFEKVIHQLGKFPIINKTAYGSMGAGISILESKKSAKSVIQSFIAQKTEFILQEYIDYVSDVRAIVIGDKVLAMERKRIKGDFRSNISMGAEGEFIQLSESDKNICIRAANAIGLSVCGVDLLRTKDKTYVIEVNSNFGFKIQKITKQPIAKYIIDYAVKQANLHAEAKVKTDIAQRTINTMQDSILELSKRLATYEEGEFAKLAEEYQGETISYLNKHGDKRKRTIRKSRDIFKIAEDILIFNK